MAWVSYLVLQLYSIESLLLERPKSPKYVSISLLKQYPKLKIVNTSSLGGNGSNAEETLYQAIFSLCMVMYQPQSTKLRRNCPPASSILSRLSPRKAQDSQALGPCFSEKNNSSSLNKSNSPRCI